MVEVSVSAQKLYAAYLWFKQQSGYGNVHKRELDKRGFKNQRSYWGKKLVKQGWVVDMGEYYQLKSYQFVWTRLGVNRVKKSSGHIGFGYTKIDFIKEEGNFLKKAHESIQCTLVDRKKAQITKRLSAGLRRSISFILATEKPLFSVYATAKLLGYQSSSSGKKYRDKYFDVIKEPLKIEVRPCRRTEDVRPMFPCHRIHLQKIYH